MPSWITKKIFAWSLYDFADTSFSALFVTFFFPVLIKNYLGGDEFHIGLSMGLSGAVAAFLVPLIGTLSDKTGRRTPIILVSTLITAALVVLTGYAGLVGALIFGALAHIAHLAAKDVYDAKMADIAPSNKLGAVSGLGIGMGYFGTILSLLVGYLILSFVGWDKIESIQAIFWEVAIFYMVFSIPLFLYVPDEKVNKGAIKLGELFKKSVSEIQQTLAIIVRGETSFARFLLASFMYNNAMNTVIVFLYLYGEESFGITPKEFFVVFGILAIFSAAGSFISGKLSDKHGPARIIRGTLYVWIALIIVLIIVPSYPVFLGVGAVGGMALGAIWTLNRHMVALVAPKEKRGELFGFEGLTEKFSGVTGPIIFGFFARESYTIALFSVIAFFILGLILLRWFEKKID